MFVCRMCRKEVTQNEEGTYDHVEDGSPACIVEMNGAPMPDWNRHERVEASSTDDVISQLQAEEDVKKK